jgi:hypothetical protein
MTHLPNARLIANGSSALQMFSANPPSLTKAGELWKPELKLSMPTFTMLPGAVFPQREQFFRRGLNLASAKALWVSRELRPTDSSAYHLSF